MIMISVDCFAFCGQRSCKSDSRNLRNSMVHPDAMKVQHVVEVVCARGSNPKAIMALFKRFDIQITSLLRAGHRYFACLLSAKWALHAVNVIRDAHFKLKKIDCDPNDIKLLKNKIPPPNEPDSRPPLKLVRFDSLHSETATFVILMVFCEASRSRVVTAKSENIEVTIERVHRNQGRDQYDSKMEWVKYYHRDI